MKLKIVSDGTNAGTYVCHAETGERLAGVQLLSWSASCEESLSEATLHIAGVACEITSEVGIILDDVLEQSAFPVLPKEYENLDSDEIVDITSLIRDPNA